MSGRRGRHARRGIGSAPRGTAPGAGLDSAPADAAHGLISPTPVLAHECRIRDFYVRHLHTQRPAERLVAREVTYPGARARADLRTVDRQNVVREWEFKIFAHYEALGQILIYVALARRERAFAPVRGVIAAFEFSDELRMANEVMNLNLDLVTIPGWMRGAGRIPTGLAQDPALRAVPVLHFHPPAASTALPPAASSHAISRPIADPILHPAPDTHP